MERFCNAISRAILRRDLRHTLFHANMLDWSSPHIPDILFALCEDLDPKITPKILPALRELFGVRTFIVGFTLHSGVSRDARIAAARNQLRACRTNLCIAIDHAALHENEHPILIVTPEGGAIDMTGTPDEVAEQLVAFVLRRYAVTWTRSTWQSGYFGVYEHPQRMALANATDLLAFAQHAHLLTDSTDGNISVRCDALRSAPEEAGLFTTPRQIAKDSLTASDLIPATVLSSEREVWYDTVDPSRKPSIDTAVHAWLYRHLPQLGALVHFHDTLVLPTARTTFPYPCGTIEEAEEIARVLTDAAMRGVYRGGAFTVELVHHGYLLGLTAEALSGTESVSAAWERAMHAYVDHLTEIGEGALAQQAQAHRGTLQLQPIFRDPTIIGVFARETERGFSSCFLLPEYRGGGTGSDVLTMLDTRGVRIGAHDRCEVTRFYTERGWQPVGRDGAITLLDPPSLTHT